MITFQEFLNESLSQDDIIKKMEIKHKDKLKGSQWLLIS